MGFNGVISPLQMELWGYNPYLELGGVPPCMNPEFSLGGVISPDRGPKNVPPLGIFGPEFVVTGEKKAKF